MEKQQFIEKATNKINTVLNAITPHVKNIQFEGQGIYNRYWIIIHCENAISLDDLNKLSRYFNDPLITVIAVNDEIRVSIYAAIH